MRGILDRTKTPYESIEEFVLPYTKSEESPDSVVDLDNPPPSQGAQLPAVPAVEFLADIRESQGRIPEATEVRPPANGPVDRSHRHLHRYSCSNNWGMNLTRFGSGELLCVNFNLKFSRLICPPRQDTGTLGSRRHSKRRGDKVLRLYSTCIRHERGKSNRSYFIKTYMRRSEQKVSK